MSRAKILIIDDETSIRSTLKGVLEDEGFVATPVESGEEGLALLGRQSFDLILLDIWLPGLGGLDVLRRVMAMDDRPRVIMISGHGTVETAVQATKLGAYDFLEKPLTLEKVILTVKNALTRSRLEEENIRLQEKLARRYELVGDSPPIRKLREDMERAAPSDGRVLIFGENGTGKELVARLLHGRSRREDKRFVEFNCAAVPPDMMEADLFGAFRGEPPQAALEKKGKLPAADGGTIYFDEVGDLTPGVQANLVRVIEERAYLPPGASEPVPLDVRIIASSSKNLKELTTRGKFREDLFFKLNVIPLTIPPLRERPEDIPALIDHFLARFAAEYGRKPKTMRPEALQAFRNYSWPGNVSELMNVLERFIIMVEDPEIRAEHLSLLVEAREAESAPELGPWPSLLQAREQFDRRYIHQALLASRWNLDQAASRLKVPVADLRRRIEELKISLIN
ncbi:MAG: sigma-54-dependent Fis family transcriptional regulator [Candidatus Aminicenantes bacterium]|nr:sigma-54-dependent Fis family transcriptional regulator [Candidatus Aminicenantes bacterium]